MEAADSKSTARRLVLWPILLTVVLTAESVSKVSSVGPEWMSPDKVAHFAVFGLLATAIVRLERVRARALAGAALAVVLVSAYGGLSEWLQSFTSYRSMEFDDWVADTLGAAVAAPLYLRWAWYRRLLERPIPAPRGADGREPQVDLSGATVPNPRE
jgi:VanZ family protein